MSVKTDFAEALRTTPDGISAFLETEIPEFSEIALPTTEAEAIIAQGILAYNVNLLLKAFEGLTIVELLLRIGQHNNVAEAMLFSGLEYLQDAGANTEFDIIEPVDGKSYAAGDIRIVVKSKGKISTVDVTVDHNSIQDTVNLAADNTGKMFYGFVRCDETFDYTFTFSASFNASNDNNAPPEVQVKTQTVTISITADGENPSGTDLTAFNIAAQEVAAKSDGVIHRFADKTVDNVVGNAESAALWWAVKKLVQILIIAA